MNTLSIGWSQAQAKGALKRFRGLYGFNLILQSLVALVCVFLPGVGAWLTGIEPSAARPLLQIWGAMVIAASALQFVAYRDPIRLRFQVGVAIAIRVWMAVVFIFLGLEFWRFAAFDAVFAVVLAVLFHRALIAELQTRP
jgi:hypothetical protein